MTDNSRKGKLMFRYRFFIVVMLLSLLLNGLNFSQAVAQDNAPKAKSTLVVGSTQAPEQLLLSQLVVALLKNAGYTVEDKTGQGDATTVHAALLSGKIDLDWEESGTALLVYHKLPAAALPTK